MNDKPHRKTLLYLDNCSFNRPYDDLALFKNFLEAEAKMHIQKEILQEKFALAWSYIMDYEVSFNPFSERKSQISKWKRIAKVSILESEGILVKASQFMAQNIKPHDALHLACAIEAGCDYFITTDSKILKAPSDKITPINPIDFVRIMEARP